MDTAAFWRELGFEEISTGGGCTAYRHEAPEVGYILVTDYEASAPGRMSVPVMVGFYPDGMDDQCAVYFNCDNSFEAAAILDKIGAEWSIPRP